MTNSNKVTVTIHGQEYTISGDKPRDKIVRIADRVDKTMSDIAEIAEGISASGLAVLTAVNIADELFSLKEDTVELEQEKEQLQKDTDHYAQLWEEAKKNFLQYKEDAQVSVEQKEMLQGKLSELTIENDRLSKDAAEKDAKIEELEAKVNSLNNRLKSRAEGQNVSVEQIKVLEDKYKEVEGNYFELQMENIRLKGDLDKYRKDEDDF